MIGRKLIKIVDTPGLLDPYYARSDHELEEFAELILTIPNGIHAIGLVIKIGNRVNAADVQMIEQILGLIDLIPYTFVIFSNAHLLGETHKEHQDKLKNLLKECPEILHTLLQNINDRYIILESLLIKGDDYYCTKVDELIKIVNSIITKKKTPFTCVLNDISKLLLQSGEDREKCAIALKKDLKVAKKLGGTKVWQNLIIFIGGSAGGIAGALVGSLAGPVGTVAASTAGIALTTSAVATIVGVGVIGGGVVGSATVGATGYGIAKGIEKCHNQ